jgi:glycerol-1-phosphate dehydrogenase [NAD(P)+]
MSMNRLTEALARAKQTRQLLLGRGVLAQSADVFHHQFGDRAALVVADRNTRRFADAALPGAPQFVFDDPHLYAEFSHVEELEAALRRSEAIPIAVGSGTINDLTKLAAHHLGRPYMCVATAASMDGYTAYGASITHHGEKQTFECPAPRAVVADIDVIANAPREMTASGFADLMAKLTAGADWILADALGVEPIESHAWETVQGGLREALTGSIQQLTEGLMMSGLAMQAMQSSRPASGAEHQFSHLWEMEHATDASHGFKVGVAMIAVAKFYEALFDFPTLQLREDLPADRIDELFDQPGLREVARRETAAKSAPKSAGIDWPGLVSRLRAHLPPWRELAGMLEKAGAPLEPQQIGIPTSRLRDSFVKAYHIRRRFTVLDLTVRAGVLDEILNRIYPHDDE